MQGRCPATVSHSFFMPMIIEQPGLVTPCSSTLVRRSLQSVIMDLTIDNSMRPLKKYPELIFRGGSTQEYQTFRDAFIFYCSENGFEEEEAKSALRNCIQVMYRCAIIPESNISESTYVSTYIYKCKYIYVYITK